MKKFELKFEMETNDVLEHEEVKNITSHIWGLCNNFAKYKLTLVSVEEKEKCKIQV